MFPHAMPATHALSCLLTKCRRNACSRAGAHGLPPVYCSVPPHRLHSQLICNLWRCLAG